eukprot:Tamp_13680.p1 GENE.Tamp_13680~~Tamp_13680.p1  ORF type:complete len:295 (-),score=32.68 Tamp_13680:386-1270(-)
MPASQRPPEDAPGEPSVWVRYIYDGAKLNRDGRNFRLKLRQSELQRGSYSGSTVLEALKKEGVDLARWCAMTFDSCQHSAGGGEVKRWSELTAESSFLLSQEGPHCLDIKMCGGLVGEQLISPQRDGFFTIGVAGGKKIDNIGTLWRTAYQLDAKGLFVIGHRYGLRHMEKTDVIKTTHKIPTIHYSDWDAFRNAAPHDAQWVAVGNGGEPLESFCHPPCAVYILGTDDDGLPPSVVESCHARVMLPTIDAGRVDVTTAGSLVMYDRVLKQAWESEWGGAGRSAARAKRGRGSG